MMKSGLTATKVVGAVTLLLAEYAVVSSLPDLFRYIKISTM